MSARSTAISVVAVTICLGIGALLTSETTANSRDADGTRMQARQIPVGKWHDDSLDPPDDAIDWLYFKVDSPRSVTVTLKVTSPGESADLTLTSAVGDQIEAASTSGRAAKLTHRLDPGLFYVSVASRSAVPYRLRVE